MAETTELKKTDFYFDLPQELIAQDPLEDRSSSRLLVLDKIRERSLITFSGYYRLSASRRLSGVKQHQGDSSETFGRTGRYRRTCGSPSIKTKRSGCLGDSGKARQEMQARSAPDLRGWTIKGRSPGDCGRR